MINKKEKLKNILLNSNLENALIIYRLLNKKCLDKIIVEIDNFSSPIKDEEFLEKLNLLILKFQETFPTLNTSTETIMKIIIDTNSTQIREFLLNKINDENQKTFLESIYKIFINNFIENSKYIPNIQNVFDINNIKFKGANDSSYDKLLTIKDFIADLVLCTNSNYINLYLFDNIDYKIDVYDKKDKGRSTKNKKSNVKDFNQYKNSLIVMFNTQYNRIFDNYNNKKQYLEFFKL